MKHTTIALITAGICTWAPFYQLPVLTRLVGIIAVYMCVRFFTLDLIRTVRRYRRGKKFKGIVQRGTLPGKEHTLRIGRAA